MGAAPILLETTWVPTVIATLVWGSARVFLARGGMLPFLPLPFGIVEVTSAVRLGTFFFFTMAIKSGSFPLHSATATV